MDDIQDKDQETQDSQVQDGEGGKGKTDENQETQSEITKPDETTSEVSNEKLSELRESITKDVSGKVSKSVSQQVIAKIGEALGLTKKEEEELPNDAKKLQKIINDTIEERFSELQEKQDQQSQKSEKERQTKIKGIVNSWYGQYNQLARMGKVPQIKENKEGDPGFDARKRLIITIGKMIEQNKSQGIDYTPTVSDVLVAYPKVLDGPPGADFPISGNTRVAETAETFKYTDVHDKSFEEIAAEQT